MALGFFDAAGAEEAAQMLMEIGLEKMDGAVFGVGDAAASLPSFTAGVANHGHG